MDDTTPPDDPTFADAPTEATIVEPPTTIRGILKHLGPGLIIAGSIVGSGELIATTAVGAEAGFWLLWLIIVGCVIKVFAQVEFGRYSIVQGKTTMDGLNEVPGPRLQVNWILWCWLVMFIVSLFQLGGIVGGVGQALAISRPLTEAGRILNHYHDTETKLQVTQGLIQRFEAELPATTDTARRQQKLARMSQLVAQRAALQAEFALLGKTPAANDDFIWAAIVTAITIVVLVVGRYNLVQTVSTILVALFTLITIGTLIHLQSLPDWRVSFDELARGLSFRLPPSTGTSGAGLTTALATFGIIGVGATELIQYPYWCLEKGYARWVGPRDQSDAWVRRADGWLRVMRWDAWCSMIVYSFSTVAFYLLGAAVLGRIGLNPSGTQMVRTLTEMYVPVFGQTAQTIFLFGAFAVLYSTFFVANAGHARVSADAMRLFGLSSGDEKAMRFWTIAFCVIFPLTCLVVYLFIRAPKQLILASALMQALMLPLLAVAALYFRYRRCDDRIKPGKLWDLFLWLSGAGLMLSGSWALWDKVSGALGG